MKKLTERQEKVYKILKGTIIFMLFPIWLPVLIVQHAASSLNFFLEEILLYNGEELIDNFSHWIAKKTNKK